MRLQDYQRKSVCSHTYIRYVRPEYISGSMTLCNVGRVRSQLFLNIYSLGQGKYVLTLCNISTDHS